MGRAHRPGAEDYRTQLTRSVILFSLFHLLNIQSYQQLPEDITQLTPTSQDPVPALLSLALSVVKAVGFHVQIFRIA